MKARPTMARDLDRYEKYGWDYPIVAPLSEEETRWHIQWARRTGGPVLGLACGTGRLLCRLAEDRFDTVGIDLSDTMLQVARGHRATLPPEARKRLHLVKADMSRFDLGRSFGLVLIADNSFRELPTRKALLACLRCIRRHLLPTGRLLITERRFDPDLYPSGVRSFGWSQPVVHRQTGHLVSRKGHIHISRDRRRMRGEFTYKTCAPDGSETIDELPWSGPILTRSEYLWLFAAAGFHTEVFGDYHSTEPSSQPRLWCFVCSVRTGRKTRTEV